MDARSRPPGPIPAGGRTGLSLAWLGGTLAVLWLPAPPPLWTPLLLLLPWPWLGRARLPWLVFIVAAVWCLWRIDQRLDQTWPAARHGEDLQVLGFVADLPERRVGDWRFAFVPEDPAVASRIRVAWYRSEAELRAGQCWRLRLRMRMPHGSLNPGGFDYERWLFASGYGASAYVRGAERCAGRDRRWRVDVLRQTLVERLQRSLPDHPGLPLLRALVVGDRSGLSDADWRALRLSGTSHLVAISGLHIALIAGFAFLLARHAWSAWPRLALLWPAQRVGAVAGLLAALLYAALAGFSVPTLRALLMLAVFVLAGLLGRGHTPWRTLALAAALVLGIDPFAALSAGFWLSFGAVAAILYAVGGRSRPPPPLWAFLRLQALLGLLLVPASLAFFDGASLAAPLVNLLAVPLFAVLLPLLLASVLAALAGWVLPLGLVASALSVLHGGLLMLAQRIPQSWLGLAPNPWALVLAILGVLLLTAPRGMPLRGLGLVLCLPLLLPPDQAPRRGFSLTALDVGQGLAVVVRTAHHSLLYDAGPAYEGGFDAGEAVVVPYLHHVGLRRLDRLLLSHGDSDHAGGVPAVRAAIPIADEIGTARPCRAGERWHWDGVDFELLHPRDPDGSDNNRSCVLRIGSPYGSALLTGDIEQEAEQQLLRRAPDRLRADVLLAPHHGSRTSSTPAFVAAVAPRMVIFAAGWRHHFGHPREEIVARYERLGAATVTTGVAGAVTVRLDGTPLRPTGWRAAHRRYWNAPAEP